MKRVAALVLLALGLLLLLLSVLGFDRTDTVTDISFVLEPGEKYGPYDNGTAYHTRILRTSTLMGEVLVAGGSINFTVTGYNAWHLRNIVIDRNCNFAVKHANDLYTFTFDNTGGNVLSSITFTLQERWMNTFLLIPGFMGMLLMVLGISIELRQRRKGRRKVESEYQAR